MTTLDTTALVLRVVDFGESDRIAHLLTPATSRITVIAKGARRSRRRFPGTLDLLNLLAVRLERRRAGAMIRLEQGRLVDAFPALRGRPARFALGCYVAELTDRLAPEGSAGPDGRRLFEAVLGSLRTIAERPPETRLRIFLELRLLAALGLRPELARCVRCGRSVGSEPGGRSVGFSVAEGGPVDAGCTGASEVLLPIHLGTLRALDQGLRLPLDRLDRLGLGGDALREAEALLTRFQRFHAGVELRSERVLRELLGGGAAA